jgi:hypothetical protein
MVRMTRLAAGLVACCAALMLASCEDEPNAKSALPTEPAPQVSPGEALRTAPAKLQGSSVCSSYLRERTKLQVKLAKAPEDKDLLKRASAMASIITDACN